MEICRYCHHEYKRVKSHELYCSKNPNKITKSIWNKGLTKESSESIRKYTETIRQRMIEGKIKPSNLGRKHTEEEKIKISKSIKKYMNEHPNKIGFIAHHSSNKSYPEKYFEEVFEKRNIPLLYHKQVSRFELDFYNENTKRYVEIDGKQHYENEKNIQRDLNRTMELEIQGWIGKRIKWEEYKRMTSKEQDNLIEEIRNFVLGGDYSLSEVEKEYRNRWLKEKEQKDILKRKKLELKIKEKNENKILRENKKYEKIEKRKLLKENIEIKKQLQKELYKDIEQSIKLIDLDRWDKNKQLKKLLYPKFGELSTKKILYTIKLFNKELYNKFQNKGNRKAFGTINQQWIHDPLSKKIIRVKKEKIKEYLEKGWKLGRKIMPL